jgi:hypothetical protein
MWDNNNDQRPPIGVIKRDGDCCTKNNVYYCIATILVYAIPTSLDEIIPVGIHRDGRDPGENVGGQIKTDRGRGFGRTFIFVYPRKGHSLASALWPGPGRHRYRQIGSHGPFGISDSPSPLSFFSHPLSPVVFPHLSVYAHKYSFTTEPYFCLPESRSYVQLHRILPRLWAHRTVIY